MNTTPDFQSAPTLQTLWEEVNSTGGNSPEVILGVGSSASCCLNSISMILSEDKLKTVRQWTCDLGSLGDELGGMLGDLPTSDRSSKFN